MIFGPGHSLASFVPWGTRFLGKAYTVCCALTQVDASTQCCSALELILSSCTLPTLTHSLHQIIKWTTKFQFHLPSAILLLLFVHSFCLCHCSRNPANTCRVPGPKSGRTAPKHHRHLGLLLPLCLFFYCTSQMFQYVQSGGEGNPSMSWTRMEAEYDVPAMVQLLQANAHDTAPPMGYGHEDCLPALRSLTSVQKRSYKRAFNRAQRAGWTWYRGHCYTVDQFPKGLKRSVRATPPRQQHQQPRAFAPRHRLQVGHVNVGGLSSDRLQELKLWAIDAELDVLLLSETRWCYENDWSDAKWHHIHSGTEADRSDGLLFLIRTNVCTTAQIGFASVLPGRIGHLRIFFRNRALDIVGCYQYTANQANFRNGKRQTFWTLMNQQASALPKRNSVLFVGDFNCSAHHLPPYTGTDKHRCGPNLKRGTQHQDLHMFMEFLKTHHLTVLNSWNAQLPPTFVNPPATSSIDHMIMRLAEADALAKDVKLYPDPSFLPCTGARHYPMICSIRKISYHHNRQSQPQVCSFRQRLQCRAEWHANSSNWQQFHNEFSQVFQHFTSDEHPDDEVIQHMHECLLPVFHRHFPTTRSHVNTAPDAIQSSRIRDKWKHRAAFQKPQVTTLRTIGLLGFM